MKFSGKVWSDHGTTGLHFGSIRVNRAMPISLLATLREDGWNDLHEIFREGVESPWDDLITFWVNSGKPRDADYEKTTGPICKNAPQFLHRSSAGAVRSAILATAGLLVLHTHHWCEAFS